MRAVQAALAALALLALPGCGVDDEEAMSDLDQLSEQLLATGGEVVDEREAARGDEPPLPYARLARDDFHLSLDDTVREDSDALVFSLDRDDDCIRVSDGSVQLPEDLEEVPLIE